MKCDCCEKTIEVADIRCEDANLCEECLEDVSEKDFAKVCDCGSVKWCLRKDGKIECYECQTVLDDATWQRCGNEV